ncbi:MAG: N-acetyltransferase [Burkholderiales bacterium]|nr:N-acetyltransferase [Burkholderiales bacterium]
MTADWRRRDAIAGDLPRIVEIYNTTIASREATADLEPVTVASRRAWFDAHGPARRPLWVAERDGGVVGWLSLSDFHPRAAYAGTAEVGIYIDPAERGRGLGTWLLDQAIAAAPGLDVHTLVALVFGHNAGSLALFSKRGFEPWGWLPGVAILDGTKRDLAILGRRLSSET